MSVTTNRNDGASDSQADDIVQSARRLLQLISSSERQRGRSQWWRNKSRYERTETDRETITSNGNDQVLSRSFYQGQRGRDAFLQQILFLPRDLNHLMWLFLFVAKAV
ncbi:hypothetical protein SKAU_G00149630 [Synaphobranchus kaupii]|uniref:Uncharacterized protein n=1 Tax=Synaphobranchus kaupii TaxID=118154 RepID=A0A9Q1FUY1_SYNKA|nr:hypothetical protein SKAU_G00149630 [Synaphobranchus kaupii]